MPTLPGVVGERMQQIVVNGIVAAAVYVVAGFGFGLIYRTATFFHIAQAAIIAVGAYGTYWLCVGIGFPLPVAVLLSVVFSAIVGACADQAIFRPLRRRGASPLVLLLASLGLYVVLTNLLSMAFGDSIKTIAWGRVEEGWRVFGARITTVQAMTIAIIALLAVLSAIAFRSTKIGITLRAVADDPELAGISGIEVDRVVLVASAVGSGLSGLAGILLALDLGMTPMMGLNVLLMGVVAFIIGGGLKDMTGLVAGGLFLGLSQHLAGWLIGPQWQYAMAFVVLIVLLLLRPKGMWLSQSHGSLA